MLHGDAEETGRRGWQQPVRTFRSCVSSRYSAISSVVSCANFTCALKTTGASGRNVGKKVFFLLKLVYRDPFFCITMAATEKCSLH